MKNTFAIEWQETGKPVVVGDVPPGVDVSLSHDGRKSLSVAGNWPQGCDIEPIRPRSVAQWKALLGSARRPLLDELIAGGESYDLAGTRLWAAAEAIRKATGQMSVSLAMGSREGDAVTFRGGTEGSVVVLTFPALLTDNEERILAFVTDEADAEERVTDEADAEERVTDEANAEERMDQGPQLVAEPLSVESLAQFDPMAYGSDVHMVARSGYPAASIRFPVGFREACNVGGSVGFANFALWLGALRERGTGPISKQIVKDMATGRWGMVTNNSEVFIDANLYTDDIVEGTIWITELTGPDRATTNLHVEWCRVDGAARTHIGWSAMQTTWVEVLSHGVVAARPMPQYFRDFIEPMTVPTGGKEIAVPAEPKAVDRGSLIRSAPRAPRNPYLLESEVFSTTLQDGNVVGNIYFGNYYIWQSRVRDKFLVRSQREAMAARGTLGELRCVHTRVEHLREVMPFDNVLVTMSLVALYEKGIDLEFEYFKVNEERSREKLAIARHRTIWTMPNAPGELDLAPPSSLPQSLIDSVLEAIDGR